MPISVRSRRAIDERIAGLREKFGDFPLYDVTRVNDPEFFEEGCEFFEAGGRGGAGARVTDDDGRVLLIRHPETPDQWSLPGGGHEPGESFVETAQREVWEETGVDCDVTGVWAATRKRYVHAEEPARRGYLLSVFFTATQSGGDAGLYPERWDDDGEEVLAVDWFSEPPSNAAAVVSDPVAPE